MGGVLAGSMLGAILGPSLNPLHNLPDVGVGILAGALLGGLSVALGQAVGGKPIFHNVVRAREAADQRAGTGGYKRGVARFVTGTLTSFRDGYSNGVDIPKKILGRIAGSIKSTADGIMSGVEGTGSVDK